MPVMQACLYYAAGMPMHVYAADMPMMQACLCCRHAYALQACLCCRHAYAFAAACVCCSMPMLQAYL